MQTSRAYIIQIFDYLGKEVFFLLYNTCNQYTATALQTPDLPKSLSTMKIIDLIAFACILGLGMSIPVGTYKRDMISIPATDLRHKETQRLGSVSAIPQVKDTIARTLLGRTKMARLQRRRQPPSCCNAHGTS
jgi:hypothetical protein